MGVVTTSPGEFALGSLNDSTGWLPLFDSTEDPCVTIRGTFVGTIALQTSDQPDATKTRTTDITTYAAAAQPFAMPRQLGGWFRLVMSAYTSGTAYIGVGAPVGPDGVPIRLRPQVATNAPAVDSFT